MNIGLFTDTYFPQVSGVATSIKTLKEQLEAQGHQVYIFTSTDPKVTKETVEPHIYRFSSVPFVWFKDRRMTYRGGIQALQIAKELNLDIVHTQTEFSLGMIGKFVARQMHIPIVHTFHTNYEDYLHYLANGKLIKPGGVAVIARYFLHGMTGIIAPSKQTYDTLEDYKITAPIAIIPTGVKTHHDASEDHSSELYQKLGIDPSNPIVVSIGRVAFEKNIDDVLTAFAQVLEQVPDAKFVIVGDGPARESLEQQAIDLGIQASVIFVGEVQHDEVYSYYRLGDVFASASVSETQGITFIESITAETPVVAMRSDYMDGIVCDESIGSLVDRPEDMAQPIIKYLKAKKAGVTLGTPDARESLLHEIDEVTFGKRIADFYKEALSIYHDDEDDDAAEENNANYVRSFLHPFRRDQDD
ncbi:1,2-diacylglycerol 3-alpha-glucosyltransferase [Weissella uvarum]|uniref:glycosyltransferase family 4 protein n=1 Tax=Weissella uvarum TaxID=1479233 RepID=UPI001960181E|nr:glycosyltransferase family 4 protein [Weissella uvarum]MBM7618021.1 1,2-diacylglycerol 3-alpha-glucosyltransferase [Weissella uvarum]MCM0596240.1 glycosyltransferase family 4 protein [Weissella uvarum]